MFARAALLTLALLPEALPLASRAEVLPGDAAEALLDVIVTDADGLPVRGLEPRDFELLLDGKRVAVTRFLEVLGETGPSRRIRRPGGSWLSRLPDAEPLPARPPRRIALVLEKVEAIAPEAREELFDGVRGLLEGLLGEGDESMIVTWDGRVRSVLDLTGDSGAIERSLAATEAAFGQTASGIGSLGRDAGKPWFGGSPRESGGPGESPGPAPRPDGLEVRRKASTLRALAAFLGGLDGRRAIVFVADRLPRYPSAARPADAASSPRGREEKRVGGLDLLPILEDLISAANAHDVSVYGLSPGEGGRDVEGLELVASRTGGFAASGPSSIRPFFERLASELDSWYVLGYSPPGRKGGAVPVSVRSRNPRLRVRSRATAVQRSPDELLADLTRANLFGPPAAPALALRAAALPTRGAGGAAGIGLDISVGGLGLVPDRAGRHATAEVSLLVVAATRDGAISEVVRRRERPEVPLEDAAPLHGRIGLSADLPLTEPGTRLSIGLRDERDGGTGFAVVTIPPAR